MADAVRRGDWADLERLSLSDGAVAQLRNAAMRRGGERRLSELLAAPAAARQYTHTPLVVGFVVSEQGKLGMTLLFQWHAGRWCLWTVHDTAASEAATRRGTAPSHARSVR